jgi:hypothetical protein
MDITSVTVQVQAEAGNMPAFLARPDAAQDVWGRLLKFFRDHLQV